MEEYYDEYYLVDCDPQNEDISYDLTERDLLDLFNCALQYCTYFSFDIPCSFQAKLLEIKSLSDEEKTNKSWEQNKNIWKYFNMFPTQGDYCRKYYQYNEKTIEGIKQLVYSLFELSNSKEDLRIENLTFYRSDDTIFFCSETHEGQAFLFVKNHENVEQMLKNVPWQKAPIDHGGFA